MLCVKVYALLGLADMNDLLSFTCCVFARVARFIADATFPFRLLGDVAVVHKNKVFVVFTHKVAVSPRPSINVAILHLVISINGSSNAHLRGIS